MRVVGIIIALAVACTMGLAGVGSAEEKETKAVAPSTAEKKEPVKVSPEEANKIVAAKVNGTEITLDEVSQMVNRITKLMARTYGHGGQMPDQQEIEKEAYDKLIAYELVYQKAKAEGMKVKKSDVDAGIERIKESMGGEKKYEELVGHDKEAEAMLRSKVEKDIMVRNLYAKEVSDKVHVSEAQMKEEYEKEKKRFIQPEKISLVDVIIPLKAGDKSSDSKAQDILKKIKDNADDPNKLTKDETFTVRDYAPDKEKDKELIEAAKKLKTGEVSGIIKTGDGLHIIKLKEYVPEKQLAFDEVKGSIDSALTAHAQTKKAKEWIEGLKKEAKIEILLHRTEK